MLNSQEWWHVIRNYNQSIFPMQIIVMLIGIAIITYLPIGSNAKANKLLKAYLGLSHLWIGSVFFILLGKDFPSPLKQIQGSLFILIGLLFLADIVTQKTILTFPKSGLRKWLTLLGLIAIIGYPFVGIALDRSLRELIYPGTLPCATTALSLVLLAASCPKVNKLLYTLLLIWAIPFPPLIQIPKYHVYEDGIMFVIGIYAFITLIVTFASSKNNMDLKKHKEIFQIKKDAVLATSSLDGFANIVPIHSKHLISNNQILISDQFMNKTKKNLLENPYAVLSIVDKDIIYTMSGKCSYKTSGILYALAVRGARKYAKRKAQNKNIQINCKGIILMKVVKFEIETI